MSWIIISSIFGMPDNPPVTTVSGLLRPRPVAIPALPRPIR